MTVRESRSDPIECHHKDVGCMNGTETRYDKQADSKGVESWSSKSESVALFL